MQTFIVKKTTKKYMNYYGIFQTFFCSKYFLADIVRIRFLKKVIFVQSVPNHHFDLMS